MKVINRIISTTPFFYWADEALQNISFAKDTYRSIFSREEAKTIKSAMEAFGKDKEDYKTIGTFLVFTADNKEPLSNSGYSKAVREVDDIAIGRYEQAQKRGNSMKL